MDYNQETGEFIYETYIMVVPDENGIYHFVSNGYFITDLIDTAGNRNSSILVNGELVEVKSEGMDFGYYYIENVDTEPPEFAGEPVFTVNEENGSFKISAKTDSTAQHVYLKFDDAYSAEISGSDEAGTGVYEINNVPRLVSGGHDIQNGEISAEIYVKYSEDVPVSSVTLVVADSAGNNAEYKYTFKKALYVKKAEVLNPENENGYPVYSYGGALEFTVPVRLDGFENDFACAHSGLPIYADGITRVSFTDLFGESGYRDIYADIFGAAFAHTLVFSADGKEITPDTAVSADVTVKIEAEGWQSIIEARTKEEIEKLLASPTNNTIKLFMTFDELLSGAAVKAFENSEEKKELLPTGEYVTAAANGKTLTVEFKQNCQAKITVYDLRGNALTIWRPEDGPVRVIDRDAPKLSAGYPRQTFENNTVTLEYAFADGEEVMLLQEHDKGYQNIHSITFSENGQQILNFADRAGNVFSDYPVISGIDRLAPKVKMSVDFVGDGMELSAEDSYKAGNVYTSKNVRILLNVADDTADGISVAAKAKSGADLEVKKENITANGKPYNYYFVVTENGAYNVSVTDKWGNENFVETSVSVIDRTAPVINFADRGAVIVKKGTDKNSVSDLLLTGVTAVDLQSGANAPMGDKAGEVNDGVRINVDMSDVDLDKTGTYNAKITASDRLGNTAEKLRTVTVLEDMYSFTVNGVSIYANDVFITSAKKVRLADTAKTAKFYYAKGYKTAAQMKYAKAFDAAEGFETQQKGYYTILAQESNRKMYLLYVYVN